MRTSKKTLIIILIVGIGIFGYSQYAFATQIGVNVAKSQLLEKTAEGSTYSVQLEFDNPSLLLLNAGETDFVITIDEKEIAEGVLEPFVLPGLSKVMVKGEYQTTGDSEKLTGEEIPSVKISGITKYDALFTTINVPFIYFPTEDQAREFIHQK